MSKNSANMKNMNSSKIIGIQFSILSPEEIRKGSVAEITSKEAYINNKPVNVVATFFGKGILLSSDDKDARFLNFISYYKFDNLQL